MSAGYEPRQGFAWNPLRKWRNMPCPCESGAKAKRCHGKFEVIPAHVAIELARLLSRVVDSTKRAKR